MTEGQDLLKMMYSKYPIIWQLVIDSNGYKNAITQNDAVKFVTRGFKQLIEGKALNRELSDVLLTELKKLYEWQESMGLVKRI